MSVTPFTRFFDTPLLNLTVWSNYSTFDYNTDTCSVFMYFYNVNVTTHRTNEIRHNIIQTHDTAKLGWRYHTDIPDTCNHCTYCVSVHQLDANCVCLVGNLSIKSVLVRVWYFQMTIFTLSSFKWLRIWADGWWTCVGPFHYTGLSQHLCEEESV